MSINNVTIGGNLTRDPELKATAGGMSVLAFSVAVNERKKQGDQWVDDPHFFDCEIWGNRAVSLAERIKKGDRVTVQGRLKQQRWQAKDGTNKSRVIVNANEVQLMAGGPSAKQMVQRTFGEQTSVYADEDIPF